MLEHSFGLDISSCRQQLAWIYLQGFQCFYLKAVPVSANACTFLLQPCMLTTAVHATCTQAGVTTLINRTYIVIKHLGSGTYGQVKLAFNLKDRKLYAIKACRKSQYSSIAPAAAAARCDNSGSKGCMQATAWQPWASVLVWVRD